MKFCSKLTEATLLKRSIKFLVEAALLDKQRIMLRCPNLGRLLGCDILGTKLWFSNPIGYHCLPTWELAEVDGGHLVCVNPEYILSLVLDGIKAKVITELADAADPIFVVARFGMQTAEQSLHFDRRAVGIYHAHDLL